MRQLGPIKNRTKRKIGNRSESIVQQFRYYIKLHEDLFHPLSYENNFELRLKNLPVDKDGLIRREIMERAVSRLVLTTYSNVVSGRKLIRGQKRQDHGQDVDQSML